MATESAKKGEQQRLRRELGEKAVAFYAKHNVASTVEKLLNEMFVAAPTDVYGYMSEYFSDLSVTPVICAAKCTEGLDERGGRALDVSIHCTVHGVDKYVTSVSVPVNPHPPPPPSPPPTTSPSKSGKKKVAAETGECGEEGEGVGNTEEDAVDAFESFNTYIVPVLLSQSPDKQVEIDNTISCLRDKDGRELHSSALLATSMAIAKSATLLSSTPLYDHLSSVFLPTSPSPVSPPTPVTSLLAGGCGKLRVREFCIVPLPGRVLTEQVSGLCSLHRSVGALLSAKTGAAGGATLTSGVYRPSLDRLEAGMELVREAATHSGLTLGEDLSVLVDVGAERLFDQEKCKYELVSGQWKSNLEVISLYSDLLTSHPGLMGFIDPLHPKDVEGWKKLQETLGSKCLLVADKSLNDLLVRPRREIENKELVTESEAEKSPNGRESREDGLESLSCASLTLEKTLSATFSKVMSVRGSANYIMLSAPPTLTVNPLLVDLAVALQCALFRMGAPLGLTSTCLLSRMLQIRQELSARGTYKPANALIFSCTPSSHLLSV